MRRVDHQMKHEGKDRLKPALSENYRGLYEQDHSDSLYLFSENLAESSAKKT